MEDDEGEIRRDRLVDEFEEDLGEFGPILGAPEAREVRPEALVVGDGLCAHVNLGMSGVAHP